MTIFSRVTDEPSENWDNDYVEDDEECVCYEDSEQWEIDFDEYYLYLGKDKE